jgi:hypothetical protein
MAAEASFERHLAEAFARVAARLPEVEYARSKRVHGRDGGYDAILESPQGKMIVQAKHMFRSPVSASRIREIAGKLHRVAELDNAVNAALVVTNADLSRPMVERQIRELSELETPICVVRWRSPQDDHSLAEVVAEWLGSSGPGHAVTKTDGA